MNFGNSPKHYNIVSEFILLVLVNKYSICCFYLFTKINSTFFDSQLSHQTHKHTSTNNINNNLLGHTAVLFIRVDKILILQKKREHVTKIHFTQCISKVYHVTRIKLCSKCSD